jgi:hypothetical protein
VPTMFQGFGGHVTLCPPYQAGLLRQGSQGRHFKSGKYKKSLFLYELIFVIVKMITT